MHAINGYVYCNAPGLAFRRGRVVRWVMLAFGSESEFHSPYFANQVGAPWGSRRAYVRMRAR